MTTVRPGEDGGALCESTMEVACDLTESVAAHAEPAVKRSEVAKSTANARVTSLRQAAK